MAKKIDTEKYKPIPGFPGYFIAEDGEVIGKYGRPKKPQVSKTGHHQVNTQVNGKAKKLEVAKTVLRVFGEPEQDFRKGSVIHLDGDNSNNHVSNLRWVTASERREHILRTQKIAARPQYELTDKTDIGLMAASYTLKETDTVRMYHHEPKPPRPPKPGRVPTHPRPDGDESNDLPQPAESSRWTKYVRLIHQRLAQSNFDSNELKVLLVFINFALQEKRDPRRYLSEYEVGFATKMERAPLSRGLSKLKGKGILKEPPDLPEGSFYYALNGKHMFFQFKEEDILEVYGDDYEDLHQYLIPDDFEDLPPVKRAAIERVYVPAVLSEHTWLTAEQVAEICGVSAHFVHKRSASKLLAERKPPDDVLRCLRKNGTGEKRFEWPEVDRWRRAIFYAQRVQQEPYQEKAPSGRKAQPRTYFAKRHWSQRD